MANRKLSVEELALRKPEPDMLAEQDVVKFAELLVEKGVDIDLRECFRVATDVAAYIRAVHDKTMVQASRYVPGTVKAIGERALGGDLDAAKLLFDYLGLRVKAPLVQANTAVQINVPTLKDIIQIGPDGEVVGDDGVS